MKITRRAITLLEIMIVIFIIGLIGSVLSYSLKGSLDEGRSFKCEQGSKQVYDFLTLKMAEGTPLNDLLNDPKKYLNETGFIENVDKMFKDGWSKEYVIKPVGEEEFIVYSKNWENYLEKKKHFDKEKMQKEYPWAFHFSDDEISS